MFRPIRILASFICWGLLAACATTPAKPVADEGPRIHSIRVISNGWHTAIVIPRAEITPPEVLPEADDFPDAAFLELGWGDRDYYPAKEKTLGLTLGAAFLDTPAVMHMAGLAFSPERTRPDSEVVLLRLTADELQRLVRAISDEFMRPENGRAVAISEGLYPNSNFYDAHGSFHLFNTCNTWTARMLHAAGVDISADGIMTADELMRRLRALSVSNKPSGHSRFDIGAVWG